MSGGGTGSQDPRKLFFNEIRNIIKSFGDENTKKDFLKMLTALEKDATQTPPMVLYYFKTLTVPNFVAGSPTAPPPSYHVINLCQLILTSEKLNTLIKNSPLQDQPSVPQQPTTPKLPEPIPQPTNLSPTGNPPNKHAQTSQEKSAIFFTKVQELITHYETILRKDEVEKISKLIETNRDNPSGFYFDFHKAYPAESGLEITFIQHIDALHADYSGQKLSVAELEKYPKREPHTPPVQNTPVVKITPSPQKQEQISTPTPPTNPSPQAPSQIPQQQNPPLNQQGADQGSQQDYHQQQPTVPLQVSGVESQPENQHPASSPQTNPLFALKQSKTPQPFPDFSEELDEVPPEQDAENQQSPYLSSSTHFLPSQSKSSKTPTNAILSQGNLQTIGGDLRNRADNGEISKLQLTGNKYEFNFIDPKTDKTKERGFVEAGNDGNLKYGYYGEKISEDSLKKLVEIAIKNTPDNSNIKIPDDLGSKLTKRVEAALKDEILNNPSHNKRGLQINGEKPKAERSWNPFKKNK